MNDIGQIIDGEVSKYKFDHELSLFQNRQDTNRKRGIFLLDAEFPNMEFLFLASNLLPPAAIFAVRINFDNYDLVPLSVQFINPFTREFVKANEMLTTFKRKPKETTNGTLIERPALLQFENPTSIPFICIPGVREYHNHPFHTGDSWFLYRKQGGIGTLGYLIDKLYEYGTNPITGYQINVVSQRLNLGWNPNLLTNE